MAQGVANHLVGGVLPGFPSLTDELDLAQGTIHPVERARRVLGQNLGNIARGLLCSVDCCLMTALQVRQEQGADQQNEKAAQYSQCAVWRPDQFVKHGAHGMPAPSLTRRASAVRTWRRRHGGTDEHGWSAHLCEHFPWPVDEDDTNGPPSLSYEYQMRD